jgi:Tol biopolymer transport system component
MRTTRWILMGVLLGGMLGGSPVAAQYFGQNKVQYRTFDFKVIQTEHFEVYYYEEEREAALDAARMAERAYARLSRILHHKFQVRKPMILYASSADFQQTNTTQGELPDATGGFTEFFKHRMVMPFTGSYADFEHVLQHELVHAFQYDVYSRGRIGSGLQTLINVAPPLWFAEGMAEYLSIGPIDPHTAMWLRDAALEGGLPTVEQMTLDPGRFFPYRFGHALWSYIGEKWGDEVIGEVLQASLTAGVEGSLRRALGLSTEELSHEWMDAIQTTYLPRLANHYRARRVAEPVLTERRPGGSVHLAPALSPDGREIAFFSELNTFSLNLYIADVETGRIKHELAKSGFSTEFESLRFINSAGSFSPDGRYFAIAAKRKDRDDLVIFDVQSGKESKRLRVALNGVTTPTWSPDGTELVFTGSVGGMTDLFLIRRDGSDMRRLTNDRYADYHPVWSPDRRKIAFATDRGPATDFAQLRFGNWRIALYDVETGTIEVLPHMDHGRNTNPVWSPDGRSIAFVSDRTGIANIFLFDRDQKHIYQLTNVYTGVSGITSLSPVLSWAAKSDRLAFAYYENGSHNVYTIDNPRSLRRAPYEQPADPPLVGSLLAAARKDTLAQGPPVAAAATTAAESGSVASVYRSSSNGFRQSDETPPADSAAPAPLSVRALLDSAELALPDTTEFTHREYRTRFSPDFVARPSVGYARDNFGRGFFGGSAISLSDILGNQTLVFSAAINGRLAEAQVLAAYINQSKRLNWAVGAEQRPVYFWAPSSLTRIPDFTTPTNPNDTLIQRTFRIRRFVIRDAFLEAYYPFNRFRRLELGLHGYNVSDDVLERSDFFDADNQIYRGSDINTVDGGNVSYLEPSLALVHDRTRFGYVGPFVGTRSRLQVSPAFGGWQFTTGVFDYRRYLFARPFTLAFRTVVVGRFGRDAGEFPMFLGSTELIRGYTSGSVRDHECGGSLSGTTGPGGTFLTGCPELDQMIGSKLAVGNVELRFPLARSLVLGLLPIGLPPIEGAIFFDIGMAWDEGSQIKWERDAGDNLLAVRAPLKSWGASIRANMFGILILRFDYAKPLDRTRSNAYWTVSVGPTF